jgi:hypothetical protein
MEVIMFYKKIKYFFVFSAVILSSCSNPISQTTSSRELNPIEKLATNDKKSFDILISFISKNNFYNRSAVRVLDGTMGQFTSVNEYGYYGYLDVELQGTNALGGTMSQDYDLLFRNALGTSIYEFENTGTTTKEIFDQIFLLWDYKEGPGLTVHNIDIPSVNIAINYYWSSQGL